ncbi:phosphate uptake regulator, PhoU [Roseibium sp. TrichSKD4]|nr:phosphate uptake regulator, PhoU [Roseibium sp. TrichSKD4]
MASHSFGMDPDNDLVGLFGRNLEAILAGPVLELSDIAVDGVNRQVSALVLSLLQNFDDLRYFHAAHLSRSA